MSDPDPNEDEDNRLSDDEWEVDEDVWGTDRLSSEDFK